MVQVPPQLPSPSAQSDNAELKSYEFSGITFVLPQLYKPIKLIGKGTYGSVISAIDTETQEEVAVKKLCQVSDTVDAKRILREIIIMKNLQHDNVLKLLDVVYIGHSQ